MFKTTYRCAALVLAIAATWTVQDSRVAAQVPDVGLVSWLKADQGVDADASGRVNTWNDQSGLSNSAGAPSSWSVISTVWGEDDVLREWVNGDNEAFRDGVTAVPANHTLTRIGANPLGGDNALDGDIAAVLIYTVALSDGDRQVVEQYLTDKWLLGETVSLPAAQQAGLVLWLEADSGVFPDDGNGSFIWQSQSGVGELAAGTSLEGKKPQLVAGGSARGNLPVISFDGDDFLNVAGTSLLDSDTLSWFVVTRIDNPLAGHTLMRSSYTSLDGGATNPDSFDTNLLWGTFFDAGQSRFRSHARDISGAIKTILPPEPTLNVDRRPVIIQDQSPQGDRPVLQFGGSDDVFTDDTTDTFTWFLVFKTNTPNTVQRLLTVGYADIDGSEPLSNSGSAANTWGTFIESQKYRSHTRRDNGGIRTPTPAGAATTDWVLITAQWGADDYIRQWTNGVSDGELDGANASPLEFLMLRLGANADGSSSFDGQLAAALVYETDLGETDRQAVEQYLTNKWLTGAPALLTVTHDLVLRLEADQGVVPDADGDVIEWRDQSPRGNSAVSLISSQRPAVAANGSATGALPVIDFTGGGRLLDVGKRSSFLDISGSEDFDSNSFSWFVVTQIDNLSQNGTFLMSAYGDLDGDGVAEDNFASNHAWGFFTESNEFKNFARTSSGSIRVAGVVNTLPSWVVVSTVWNGSTGSLDTFIIEPGVFDYPGFSFGANSNPMQHKVTRIGASTQGAGSPLNGRVGEVLIYNRAVSMSERDQIEQYLLDKWFSFAADIDNDGDVDADDISAFVDCVSGPDQAYPANCVRADFDADGDVDLGDFSVFQAAF